jgi:outer membrane protein assembly factor BamD (BamD/ComL family)
VDDPGTLNHARPEPPSTAEPEEARWLREAQLAVRSGDARRALTLLDEHAARFPSGKLADAREVTRMVALCDLGARAAAREKAEHFLAEHPGSPFSDRVRRICAQP